MKSHLLIKIFVFLPLILFADYLLMALIGCSTCLFGVGEDYYCNTYCILGKTILVISALFFGYLIFPDIRKTLKTRKNGKTTEDKENR